MKIYVNDVVENQGKVSVFSVAAKEAEMVSVVGNFNEWNTEAKNLKNGIFIGND